jgi:hypothetical protein
MGQGPGQRDPTKTTPKATFDPSLFTKAIHGLGLDFHWSRAVACPCSLNDSETYQPDPTCVRCLGDGWWYINPYVKDERHSSRSYHPIKAVFAQAALKPDLYQNFGPFTFADALLTVTDDMRVGFRDRFIGVQQKMTWTETTLRGATPLVPIGKSDRTTAIQKTAMRYEPDEIMFVADDSSMYWEGTDWKIRRATLTEPKRMEWIAGRGPSSGTRYTIHYVCHPVWMVDDATYGIQHSVGPEKGLKGRDTLQTLPTTFKIKLDYLVRQQGS